MDKKGFRLVHTGVFLVYKKRISHMIIAIALCPFPCHFPGFLLLVLYYQVVNEDTADDIEGQAGGHINPGEGAVPVAVALDFDMGDFVQGQLRRGAGNGNNPGTHHGGALSSGDKLRRAA